MEGTKKTGRHVKVGETRLKEDLNIMEIKTDRQ
jgi:hypothetical protein